MAQRHEEIFEQATTRWKNETERKVRVDIVTHGHGIRGKQSHTAARKTRYTWEPGKSIDLPSELDDAIQKVLGGEKDERTGRTIGGSIQGGLAPQLTNMSLDRDDRPTLHESLNTALQEQIHRNALAAAAALNARNAQDMALIAAARASEEEASAARREDRRPPDGDPKTSLTPASRGGS